MISQLDVKFHLQLNSIVQTCVKFFEGMVYFSSYNLPIAELN